MLLKVDIEKAYDSIKWNTVLATLTLMKFAEIGISLIKACITSLTFSFLVNDQPSKWIFSQRALSQGDPISPFLFLLISHNLTVMLNFGLRNNMIPGIDIRLNNNFNHLMFADDLIIITRASRSVAKYCKLYLDIYRKLTSQSPNFCKSTIHLPTWRHRRIISAIKNSLGMEIRFFPFNIWRF